MAKAVCPKCGMELQRESDQLASCPTGHFAALTLGDTIRVTGSLGAEGGSRDGARQFSRFEGASGETSEVDVDRTQSVANARRLVQLPQPYKRDSSGVQKR